MAPGAAKPELSISMVPPLPSLNSSGKLPNLPPMFEPLSSPTLCSRDASSSISISPCPAGIFTHSTSVVPLSALNGLAEKSSSDTTTFAIWTPPTTISGSLPAAVGARRGGWPGRAAEDARLTRPVDLRRGRLDVPASVDAGEVHRLGAVLCGGFVAVDLVAGHGADLDQRVGFGLSFIPSSGPIFAIAP